MTKRKPTHHGGQRANSARALERAAAQADFIGWPALAASFRAQLARMQGVQK